METIFEVTEKLSTYSNDEIQYALLTLMLKGKINFLDLNASYVQMLEVIRKDKEAKLSDANACTLALLLNTKENKHSHDNIHWALYNLNESNAFNMHTLNEKYGYDKENDCKYSAYWRDKQH